MLLQTINSELDALRKIATKFIKNDDLEGFIDFCNKKELTIEILQSWVFLRYLTILEKTDKMSLLHFSIQNYAFKITYHLIKTGFPINLCSNVMHYSALHYVAYLYSTMHYTKHDLQDRSNKCDISEEQSKKVICLDIAEMLLKNGINKKLLDINQHSAIVHSVEKFSDPEMFCLLIKNDVFVEGDNPIYQFLQCYSQQLYKGKLPFTKIVRLIFEKTGIDLQDNKKHDAFHYMLEFAFNSFPHHSTKVEDCFIIHMQNIETIRFMLSTNPDLEKKFYREYKDRHGKVMYCGYYTALESAQGNFDFMYKQYNIHNIKHYIKYELKYQRKELKENQEKNNDDTLVLTSFYNTLQDRAVKEVVMVALTAVSPADVVVNCYIHSNIVALSSFFLNHSQYKYYQSITQKGLMCSMTLSLMILNHSEYLKLLYCH